MILKLKLHMQASFFCICRTLTHILANRKQELLKVVAEENKKHK